MTGARYVTAVLDVDSTLSAIEGIDWLARRRGPDVAASVAAVTDRAMQGAIPLEEVYGERLRVVRPTRAEVAALGDAYVAARFPGAIELLGALRVAGVRTVVVSGGLRPAILVLARSLGIDEADVHAVDLHFDQDGDYAGFDTRSPLTRDGGKPAIVHELGLSRPVIAVGDGATDAELRCGEPPAVDTFVAFTGVVARPAALRAADYVISDLTQLIPLVLP